MKLIFTLALGVFIHAQVYSQSVPSYVPTNGLVGWWGFNGNALDASGNGNHGTVNGATLTTDRFGNQDGAYSFNGNGGISCQRLTGLSELTVSIWFFIPTASDGRSMLTHNTVTNCTDISLNIVYHPWVPEFSSGVSNGTCHQGANIGSVFPSNPSFIGGWHLFTLIYRNNGDVTNYIDGIVKSNYSSPGFLWCNSPSSTLRFGGPWWSGDSQYFVGKLDDIGIWNRALTQQEITNLYNAQSAITIPTTTSCLNDTSEVTITHPSLTGVANAALRLNYNPDSLTYVGFTNLNPNFSGMTITGGNGTLLTDWNAQSNQNIPAGNTVTLRFRVNGSSPLTWDTTFVPSEFSDINFNIIPQTFVNGSLTQNTQRLTWNRTICEGQSFSLGSQTFTTAGNYQGVLPRSSGQCDTLVNLSLHVVPRETTLAATVCSNQPYTFNGQSLTSSGVYRDTLTNTLGCDSILVLNLTAHPAYNHPQTVRVCPGGTFNFGGNTLTTTGNYSHTYTTAEGCDSTVQLDFAVLDSIRIASSSGVNGFCPTFGVRLGLNAPINSAQYQWYRNGNLLSGEVSDTLMATQVGDYRLDVVISPTCSLSSNTLSISELNCNRVRGDLRYDNNPQTPLAGVPVHLKTLLGNILMSDTTDSLGMYEMVGYPNGNYLLDAGVNYLWGGVNSTDALWVSRYFTSLLTLSPLRARAGDVTGNGVTNSLDALNISRRGANLITTFAAGDFVNSRPSVVAGGNPVDMNLRALSTGDVNGSYGVVVSTPVLVLDTVYSTFPTGTATVRFTTSGSGIYERGVCWGTSPSPTISQNKSIAGTGGFGFTHNFGGLTGGTLYYVRAYARNSLGTVYSNEMSFTHATWGRCPGTPTVTDTDGNVYNTVQIGNQCWTQSNLTVSKYRNGDNIPNITDNTQWSQTNTSSTGAWCNYENNLNIGLIYGKLYNWYAVNDSRGLCPTGWHVPTDSEWNVMVKYLDPNADTVCGNCWQSGIAGGALKSTAIQPTPGGWNSPNAGATNSSGFTAGPGGLRNNTGDFNYLGNLGVWWSSSLSGANAWNRGLTYSSGIIARDCLNGRSSGFSVRCVRDSSVFGSAVIPTVTTSSATGITTNSATLGGDVTLGGGSTVTSRGVAYGLTSNPTTLGTITTDGSGVGSFVSTLSGLTASTTYYVRAYATNGVGTAYGNEISFSTNTSNGFSSCGGVTDVDGNSYQTVQIGTQCWTQSNLSVSKYRNGDNIPNITDNTQWSQTNTNSIGAWCNYNNDANNGTTYGKLYNWYAVNDSRGLCPTGWHVPTDSEWNVMVKYLDPNADTAATGWQNTNAGTALKSTTGWNNNGNGTNSSGFTGLTCGWRNNVGGFYDVGNDGRWWSSSAAGSGHAWYRVLYYSNAGVYRNVNDRRDGMSVRCVRD